MTSDWPSQKAPSAVLDDDVAGLAGGAGADDALG